MQHQSATCVLFDILSVSGESKRAISLKAEKPVAALPGSFTERRAEVALSEPEVQVLNRHFERHRIEDVVKRYSGVLPVAVGGAKIVSRNIFHPGNKHAVTALEAELRSISPQLVVSLREFPQGGRQLENVEAVLPGSGVQGIVYLCAHLDSIVLNDATHKPERDPAPGADDNCSGMAGVLAGARAIVELAGSLPAVQRREIRFVLFNSEENYQLGSLHYARKHAGDAVAMFQMDMIGFDGNNDNVFEAHAGTSVSPIVQARSLALAELIAASVGSFPFPFPLKLQTYPVDGGSDPGETRSDHRSFHVRHLPACYVTQNLFPDPRAAGVLHDPNPEYHKRTDTQVNFDYAAAIARVVTAAAWLAATR